MKTFWKFLCATALVLSFAACTEKDGENDTPADSESVRKAGDDWLERHADDGGVVDMKQLLGGFQQGVGVKISSE